MLCSSPYRRGVQEFGCGQCMPCRINKKREWSARLMLEASAYPFNSFVTLTYDEAHVPANGSLSRDHYRRFTHRLGFRYYGVGEYGSRSLRPHYHLIVFNFPTTAETSEWIQRRWGKGFTSTVDCSPALVNYITGYCAKKLSKVDDPRLAPGCIPEFSTMSRRPGIATQFVEVLAQRQAREDVVNNRDISDQIRIDGKRYSLGQTIREKIRKRVGVPDSWKTDRGRNALDWAVRCLEHPELLLDKEAKRGAQLERAAALARPTHGKI